MSGDGEVGQVTSTADYRWKFLSTVVAGVLAIGWPLAIVLNLVDPSSMSGGTWSTLMLGWLLSVVYAIGTDTYKAFKEIGDGN